MTIIAPHGVLKPSTGQPIRDVQIDQHFHHITEEQLERLHEDVDQTPDHELFDPSSAERA